MAIIQAGIQCELREVELKNKPAAMLNLSGKGTVPVLLTPEQKVIDESLAVMHWALAQSDPDQWLDYEDPDGLIDLNDGEFKYYLDRYKYHVGYPQHPQHYYRDRAVDFLQRLESCLECNASLVLASSQHLSLLDIAIFPFIRQFANVDSDWFEHSDFKRLQQWRTRIEDSSLFQQCMQKYVLWQEGQLPIIFPTETVVI